MNYYARFRGNGGAVYNVPPYVYTNRQSYDETPEGSVWWSNHHLRSYPFGDLRANESSNNIINLPTR